MPPCIPADDTPIKSTLTKFCNNVITLDEMFTAILPKELIQKIVHCAYGTEFYNFFISSQSLSLFNATHFDYNTPFIILKDPAWEHFRVSSKLNLNRFTFPNSPLGNPTSACIHKNPDVIFLGYHDGTIRAYPKNEDAVFDDELIYETYSSSSITALAFTTDDLPNSHDGGLLIAGHADGALSLCYSNEVERINLTPIDEKAHAPIIDIITSPEALIFAEAHTITILENYWDWKTCRGINLGSFLPYTIAGIGYYGCMVIAALENGLFSSITPYNTDDLVAITEGGLSPLHANLLYQTIQQRKNNVPASAQVIISLSAILSPLMYSVLGVVKE